MIRQIMAEKTTSNYQTTKAMLVAWEFGVSEILFDEFDE